MFPVSGKLGVEYFCGSAYFSSTENARCATDASAVAQTCGSYVSVPDAHLTGKDHHGNTDWCTTCYAGGTCASDSCTTYPNQGGGVDNIDFLIYVTAQTVGSCPTTSGSGTLAFASSCVTDQYDRPVVGYVNFCPTQIKVAAVGTSDYEAQLATAIHEIVHALGFSSSKYAYYRSHANGGQPYTER